MGTPVGSHHAFFDPCSFAMASNSYLQSVYPMPIPTPAPRPAAAVRADGVPARAQRIDARNAVKRESTHACKAALCHGISHTPEQEFCEAVGQRAYGTESSRPAPPQARRTPACARCSLCTGPMSRRPAKRGGAIKKEGPRKNEPTRHGRRCLVGSRAERAGRKLGRPSRREAAHLELRPSLGHDVLRSSSRDLRTLLSGPRSRSQSCQSWRAALRHGRRLSRKL